MSFSVFARMVTIAAVLAPAAALAQEKGGQSSPAERFGALPDCGPLPADVDSLACACPPAGAFAGNVWGSNPYTTDSDICTAARHAGAIDAEGGPIRVQRLPGQQSYPGTEANGITTRDWGSYGESLGISALNPAPAPVPVVAPEDLPVCDGLPEAGGELACRCEAGPHGGSVWGSGPYTGDSAICVSALHAGAIGPEGGAIRLLHRPGQDRYEGSDANGVSTRDWGSYGNSFDVAPYSGARKEEVADATPPPPPETDETAAETASGDDRMPDGGLPICTVLPEGIDDYACICGRSPARGEVWGVGPYTSDSDLCTAARHAGAIRAFGGELRVLRVQGLDNYAAGAANGIRTSGWDGAYDSSIIFDRNATEAP